VYLQIHPAGFFVTCFGAVFLPIAAVIKGGSILPAFAGFFIGLLVAWALLMYVQPSARWWR
jgi:hypothetical protein